LPTSAAGFYAAGVIRAAIAVALTAGGLVGCGTRGLPAAETPLATAAVTKRAPALRHLEARAVSGDGEVAIVEAPLADTLRSMVGRREPEATDITFALAALGSLGAPVDGELAAATRGRELVAIAERRGALADRGSDVLLGDLVVFDEVEGGRPSSLVGVAVGRSGEGTVEFVYLARGVIRRGWVNPARPTVKRHDDGRVLNTFVRHNDGGLPRSAPTLAGELLAAVIRLDALVAGSTAMR
jgi:hypothetical protein